MPHTITNTSLPPALPNLVDKYVGVEPKPVRFRPGTWQGALYRARPSLDVTALLRDRRFTTAIADSKAKDRTVTRTSVLTACMTMDLGDPNEVLRAFILTMAWGSADVGNQSLRAATKALRDPEKAHRTLSESARSLRAMTTLQDGGIEAAHHAWSLRGVGQTFATKWWSCAGHVAGRSWQPLILDEQVYATLNRTLVIGGTTRLASSRRRADRYRAYVETMHRWAAELRSEGRDVDAVRIEFILAQHNGATVSTR